MDNSNISSFMEITLAKIKEMVSVNTMVGDPITTPDGITLIPVSRVSFGFGSGGTDYPIKDKTGVGGGGGAGVRIDPVGFLVIKENSVRMVNISQPASTTMDRIVEMLPDVIEKVEEFIDKRKSEG